LVLEESVRRLDDESRLHLLCNFGEQYRRAIVNDIVPGRIDSGFALSIVFRNVSIAEALL